MIKQYIFFTMFFVSLFFISIYAQDVNIVLKNSKVIVGRIVEEQPEYLLLDYELGQLKINRQNIESITYNPFIKMGTTQDDNSLNPNPENGYKFVINDPVVVYLKNGNVVSGLLLAKSLSMIMLQTDSGNLTIPKNELSKIEYISSEYAERGEIVIAYLNNGKRFEGNIYFEDSENLTLDTEVGRLTVPKNSLRTIEYTGKTGISDNSLSDQYSNLTLNKRYILPHYDIFEVSYNSKFGSNYGSGFGIGYQSRFNLAQLEGMNISAVGGLSLNYFGLNTDNIVSSNQSIAADLKGGAFITTIGVGGQLNIYPQTSSFYDFYVSPILETHIIYKSFEQTYPSFPQFNTKETSTEFKFGLGTRFGVEFLFDSFKLGIQYNMHTIFSSDGYNQLSLTLVNNLF
jgi:small nuclear ribonucleoprotein (snRNP)-like protein